MIGYSLFGVRVEYEKPLFLAISPSSRHSALTVQCTRYRNTDPAMQHSSRSKGSVASWAGQYVPQLWRDIQIEHMRIDVPDYGLRRINAARNPCALIANFSFLVHHISTYTW